MPGTKPVVLERASKAVRLAAKCALLVEFLLPVLILVMFPFGGFLSRHIEPSYAQSSGLWFVRDQIAYMSRQGIDTDHLRADFTIFGVAACSALAVCFARIVLGPFLFSSVPATSKNSSPKLSAEKVFIGWLVAGPLALFSVTNIEFAAAASQINFLIRHQPRVYIFLEALVFAFAMICVAEGLLEGLRLAIAQTSWSPSENIEGD